jgi:hypothetical protein
MNPVPTASSSDTGRSTAFPGARSALVLLLLINLFNYIDRQVLAAVVKPIKQTFFGEAGLANQEGVLVTVMSWFEKRLGFKPEDALIGLLGTAFMVVYMIGAPFFARQAERWSRWLIVGFGVILWSLASGASGLAGTFVALLLTRCMVGIGERDDEVLELMDDIRAACECDILTIGQYLRPTTEHLPLVRYYTPEEFASLREEALAMGFKHVESGPLVRSSYHARDQVPSDSPALRGRRARDAAHATETTEAREVSA